MWLFNKYGKKELNLIFIVGMLLVLVGGFLALTQLAEGYFGGGGVSITLSAPSGCEAGAYGCREETKLLMHFDSNWTNYGTGNSTEDSSIYNNTGVFKNFSHAPLWTSNGKIGGAYEFVFDGSLSWEETLGKEINLFSVNAFLKGYFGEAFWEKGSVGDFYICSVNGFDGRFKCSVSGFDGVFIGDKRSFENRKVYIQLGEYIYTTWGDKDVN